MNLLKRMSVSDWLQFLGILITLTFSIIAFVQSILSKKDSKIATDLALESLNEAQKSSMPAIIFCDTIVATTKTRCELCNSITFDFEDSLLNMDEGSMDEIGEDDEQMCIVAKIKNIGKGIITGINISDFSIQSGNKVTLDPDAQYEADVLTKPIEKDCHQYLILSPDEELSINFIVTGFVTDEDDKEQSEGKIEEFINNTTNFLVSMDLEIYSINNFEYKQKFLFGTYLNNKIVHNSFDNLTKANV